MLKQAVFFLVSLLVLLFAFLFLEYKFSPVFNGCVNQYADTNNKTATEKDNRVIASVVVCGAAVFDLHGNAITAFATIVIAAFTGTLWFATSQQARLTREALIADKRAYIFAKNLGQFWVKNDKDIEAYSWQFRPIWQNTGETPPKQLRMHVECEVRNTMLPKGYDFPCDPTSYGTGIIPPKGDVFGGLAPHNGVTPQDLLDSQRLKKFIYLWGWAKYFDVFPNTPEHVTHFCWLITVSGDPEAFVPNTIGAPPTLGALLFGSIHHSEGNYIDEK